ncbi:MAG: HAD-IA family hydrolase [Candidatus Hydrogenedentes bacterium]|nr:HAD-IA family hydrolase [Candidatus Hydrogenedentota bacterium]
MDCPYKAVLFDVGQTLICTARAVGEVYVETAERFGVHVQPETLNETFNQLWAERRNSLHAGTNEDLERQWWYDLVADSFACAGLHCEPPKIMFQARFDNFFDELFDIFMRPETWCVFNDVLPSLDKLRDMGLRLAVVSNWDSRLEVLLGGLGLARQFDFILTSARAGYRKPDPRIFQVALARLGLHAGEVAHVGDSYEDDFVGATNAGIRPVLIDRHLRCPAGIPTIRSLEELPQLLTGAGVAG